MSTTKRMSDFTVAEILRNSPAWFHAKQSDISLTNTNLNYIRTIMDYGMNHIASLPLYHLFGTLDLSKFTPQQINQAIATFKGVRKPVESTTFNLAPAVTRLGLVDPANLKKAVMRNSEHLQRERDNISNAMFDITREYRDAVDMMNSYRRSMHDRLVALRVKQDMLTAVDDLLSKPQTGIDPQRFAMLKSIPEQWVVVDATENNFTVVRRKPCVMNFTNANTGMARSIYMGFFAVCHDWSLNVITCYPVADYIKTAAGSLHPHVSTSSICFGNTDHRADMYREKKDAQKYFELVESVISTYCPDNPYVSFSDFERHRESGWNYITNNALPVAITRNLPALKRMFAEYGSDKFRAAYKFEVSRGGSDAYLAEMRESESRKACGYLTGKFYDRVFDQTRRTNMTREINLIMEKQAAEGLPKGLNGVKLIEFLARHGIRVPDKDFFVRNYVTTLNGLDSAISRLILLCYGRVQLYTPKNANFKFVTIARWHPYVDHVKPMFAGTENYTQHVGDRREYTLKRIASESLEINVYCHSSDSTYSWYDCVSGPSLYLLTLVNPDADKVSFNEQAATAFSGYAPTLPVNDGIIYSNAAFDGDDEVEMPVDNSYVEADHSDEEEDYDVECDHDFRASGHCRHCDYYDQDYDEDYQQEANEDEDEDDE